MLQGAHLNRMRTIVLAGVAGLFFALGLTAVLAPSAGAQSPGSDFCQEYPNVPGCDTGPTDEGGSNPNDNGTTPVSGEGPTASADTGDELPFTGYPLTALILLLIVLLLVGLSIRGYLAIRARLGDERPPAH